ncbi:unnamed protein product, partial [Hapterophycus canaliculatus]
PGRWLGKGIHSGGGGGRNSSSSSSGSSSGGPSDTRRNRRFRFTPFAQSAFDGGESASLDYSFRAAKNGLLFSGMRDEASPLNDRLYVGLGYIQIFGGKYNSIPFLLEGPPVQDFSGPDDSKDGRRI